MRRMRGSLGLLGQLFMILLLIVVVEFGVSTLLYEQASTFSVREDKARRLAEHLVITNKLVAERPWAERAAIAQDLTTDRYEIRWTSTRPPVAHSSQALRQMERQIVTWEPALARSDVRISLLSRGRSAIVTGSLQLHDGSWILFRAQGIVSGWTLAIGRIAAALIPAFALLIVGGLLIHSTLRPISSLIAATRQVGSGTYRPITEAGTAEVRNLIHAFNEMQLRIDRLIADRMQALAAVGHDIRTPLARLQLRLDAVEEAEVRDAIAGDVAEMDGMVASLLAYLRGEDDPEAPVAIDLAVLVATIVDEVSDRGEPARYDGPDHLEATLRPLAMRRAIGNLIDNAIHYGNAARASLTVAGGSVVLAIEDDGPGIAPERLDDVLEPFVRLDTARARNTQGLGLGLAIVARTVAREAGSIVLSNRRNGGLRAEIRLPHGSKD